MLSSICYKQWYSQYKDKPVRHWAAIMYFICPFIIIIKYRVAATALANNIGIKKLYWDPCVQRTANGSLERILRIHLVSTSNMCSVVDV